MFIKNLKRLLPELRNKRGSVLLTTYLLVMALLILGTAFLVASLNESKASEVQRKVTQAFYIAEAGIERAIYDLRKDFANSQDWTDGNINGMVFAYHGDDEDDNNNEILDAGEDTDSDGILDPHYVLLPYVSTGLNGGSYTVNLMNVAGTDDIWIRSTGTVDGISQTILVYAKMINLSPWNNAIFAGAGASGQMIKGNVDIRGSVHILGNGLAPGDQAILMGGTAELVGNNYNGMPAALESRVPVLPTTTVAGESTLSETLNAEFRVRRGIVSLSGNAAVGEETKVADFEDGEKENVDGVYVTDGYEGTAGAANVHSDNSTNEAYDLGDAVVFPSLSDISPEDAEKTIQEYFEDQTPIHSNPTAVNLEVELSNLTAASVFEYYNDSNNNGIFDMSSEDGISMDGSGNMVIMGQIYVEGPVSITGADQISYNGTGTILAEGTVTITTDLVTAGINSYPVVNGALDTEDLNSDGILNPGEDLNANGVLDIEDLNANGVLDSGEDLGGVLGIMTPGNMVLGDSAQLDIMGLFYAEGQVVTNKQTDIVGTLVTNYFDTGGQVPAIYQVPETLNNLPPGMISGDPVYLMKVVSWQKIDNP